MIVIVIFCGLTPHSQNFVSLLLFSANFSQVFAYEKVYNYIVNYSGTLFFKSNFSYWGLSLKNDN